MTITNDDGCIYPPRYHEFSGFKNSSNGSIDILLEAYGDKAGISKYFFFGSEVYVQQMSNIKETNFSKFGLVLTKEEAYGLLNRYRSNDLWCSKLKIETRSF